MTSRKKEELQGSVERIAFVRFAEKAIAARGEKMGIQTASDKSQK
jgi:hypothetical protein